MRINFRINSLLKRTFSISTVILFYILMFHSCASKKDVQSSEYLTYEYKGEQYRIRSIHSSDKESTFNELVGRKFLAKDFDQDGYIDEISLGDISSREAQEIYEYLLTMLNSQSKLRQVVATTNVYQYEDSNYKYEVKSFHPGGAEPFNQLKIYENGYNLNPPVTLGIDQNADGTIDEIVKGNMLLEQFQTLYSKVIKIGLENNELNQVDNMILVK
jgi:hypothetical protein